MKITLYPKYFFRSLFVKGKDSFYSAGYRCLYLECSACGMTPWQHYVIDGQRKGYDNGNHPSGDVFFPEGYECEYPDVKLGGCDAWHHYADKGFADGRDNGLHPKDDQFFPEGYLEMYQDVADSGMDPWHHYVLIGKPEGRDCGLHPDKELFFAEGYLYMYPDAAKSGMDPWHHYVLNGKKEGRDCGLHPNAEMFFPDGYLEMYHHAAESGMDPWHHYVLIGSKDGRDSGLHPSDKVFFAGGYQEMYPDVPRSGMDPWHHYVLIGKQEGRDNGLHPAAELFFPEGYVEMYPDAAESGMDAWHHYVECGKKNGRDSGLHPREDMFFPEGYLEMYPDVAEAGIDPWRHYVLNGKKEGRDSGLHPKEDLFFPGGYLEMYSDVAESGMDPWRHYVLSGKKEGRDNGLHPSGDKFFSEGYLEMYPDVAAARIDPWHHYVAAGKQEGRDNGLAGVDHDFYLSLYPDVGEAGLNPIIHYLKFGKQEGRFPNQVALDRKKEDLDLIRNSDYFDQDWYMREYHGIRLDPVVDYYVHFNVRNPSVSFISNDYCRLNNITQKVNPLVHFEKYGKLLNRPTLRSFSRKETYHDNLREIDGLNEKTPHAVSGTHALHNKVMVFAASCHDGMLYEFRQNLIHELRQYCDYLVFVSDSPVIEDEVKSSADIDAFICRKHNRTYFGSYIFGIELLSKMGFLDGVNDLVLCNDSCFGPVSPFAPVFKKYDLNKSSTDFYGLAVSDDYKRHSFIQPYFMIISPAVYQSEIFREEFSLANVPDGIYPADVDVNVAGELTFKLTQAGFVYRTFVDEGDFVEQFGAVLTADIPFQLITSYDYPFIERKYFVWNKGTAESDRLIEYLSQEKRSFWNSVSSEVETERGNAGRVVNYDAYKPIDYSFSGVRKHFSELLPKIQNRVKSRGFIKVDFLVANRSMFACRSLIDKMLRDPRFRARIIIIPDIRWTKADTLKEYRKCVRDLTGIYGQDIVSQAVLNPESRYPVLTDIFDDKPDVAFYPMPYDLSLTPYNIPYAIRCNVLPAYINYTFPCNKYCEDIFRGINYSNLWMVFLETQFQLNDYKQNGYVNGDNAVVAGYSKMDELYDITRSMDRTKSHTYNGKVYERVIIIAPHHSLKGGYNSTMHLANFLKYAEFFQELPKNFSNILFVFRPHPALFPLLKQDNFWGEKKLEEYLKRLQENNNVVLSEEGNYFYWFAASDAMIHDCASFTVEYLYTGKPCCYMLKSESEVGEIFDDFGKQCLDCHYHAFNENDIVKFIEEVLKGHDSKRNIRTKFTHAVLLKDYPRSSEKIMNYLVEKLMN